MFSISSGVRFLAPGRGLAGRIASLNRRMPGAMGNWCVRILPVSMKTPGYLSVFVCPA